MPTTPLLLPNLFSGRSLRSRAIFQAWLPVLLLTGLLAFESTAALGSNQTSAPLHRFFQLLFGRAADHNWPHIHYMIRKAGHFAGFGILSLVFFRGFSLTLRSSATRLHQGLAIAACVLIASTDEIHQCFLPNRTGCFSDVLLDTTGAVATQLALYLVLRTLNQPRTQPAQRPLPLAA